MMIRGTANNLRLGMGEKNNLFLSKFNPGFWVCQWSRVQPRVTSHVLKKTAELSMFFFIFLLMIKSGEWLLHVVPFGFIDLDRFGTIGLVNC